jgi:hypothetical protein
VTVLVGALHAEAWPGLVLCREPGEGFALRIAVEKEVDGGRMTADGDDFFWLVREAGPHAPDGSYARISFDLDLPFGAGPETPVRELGPTDPGLTVEWGRVDEAGVVARLRTSFRGALTVRAYWPWDWAGSWQVTGSREILGRTASGRSWAAVRAEADRGVARPEGHVPEADAGAAPWTPDADGAELTLPVDHGHAVCLAVAMDPTADGALDAARALPVDGASVGAHLTDASKAYEASRPRVDGPLEGLAASVTRNLEWMVLLQPETGRRYTPAGRRWIFPVSEERRTEACDGRPPGARDHWTVFGWDSYFNALELDLEDPVAARETLLAGLRTQYPDGCVPNWRGRFGGTPDRSQPPVGSLATLKLHLRRHDLGLLQEAYPRLVAWSRWWVAEHGGRPRRAPGPLGLLTWGSDRDRVDPHAPPWERGADVRRLAGWESGQDDLPTWDEAEPFDPGQARPGEVDPRSHPTETAGHRCATTLALDPVDLNAYRVLDLQCLARIAEELGLSEEARAHRQASDELAALVNEYLWDEERESYGDRRWDGSFTRCRTASHLLVLVAGIAPEDRAVRMVEHLMDPRLFWGDFVVPTLSRDDPRFEEQQYWRGTIWPPLNYLIHAGLARCGFDDVAAEVALRGASLFLSDWRRTGLCRENFDSRTGQGGGQRHQSWGPLFALTLLEQLADVTPWDGLRIGGLRIPPGTALRNLDLGSRGSLDVTHEASGLRIRCEKRDVIEIDGPAVLRQVVIHGDRFAAEVHALAPVVLHLHLPGERWWARVDGARSELVHPTLRLAAGRHRVEVWVSP